MLYSGHYILGNNALYLVARHNDRIGMLAYMQVDILVRHNPVHLLLILIHISRTGITTFLRSEFLDHIAKVGIWGFVNATSKMNTTFGTVVSSKNRAVLNQSDLKPKSGG